MAERPFSVRFVGKTARKLRQIAKDYEADPSQVVEIAVDNLIAAHARQKVAAIRAKRPAWTRADETDRYVIAAVGGRPISEVVAELRERSGDTGE
jgi:hypothetical protein